MGTPIDFSAVVKETQDILLSESNKKDWVDRYSAYAKAIMENVSVIRDNRRRFREWSPFTLYLNTSNAKKSKKSIAFDLRYLGQSVAVLTCQNDSVTISTTKNQNRTNRTSFDCDMQLTDSVWSGLEARKFRKHFRERAKWEFNNPGNEEHRLESLLLSEFSKTRSEGKKLSNIQPVKIAGLRFPMPTPLKASAKGLVEYAKQYGGGIDILARTGMGGRNTNLCVMELKDENKESESSDIVLAQAIKYTVFIRELLKSDAGEMWWKLLGFGGIRPKKLVLFAACVMPDADNADTDFANKEVAIDGDVIRLHYVYFKNINNAIESVRTSL